MDASMAGISVNQSDRPIQGMNTTLRHEWHEDGTCTLHIDVPDAVDCIEIDGSARGRLVRFEGAWI